MATSTIKRTQNPDEITLYGNANVEFQYGGGSWVQRIIFDLNGTNKSMLETAMKEINYSVSDDGGVNWQTLWRESIKHSAKIDTTVLAGSYFDVPNLAGCTSNSCVFFQQLSEGVVGEGLYLYYLQPAAGHCLVYVRNLDGSMVPTGTRILGNLLYELS